ncbi:MAG: hypothetical protein C0622_00450 [Desulfuromonas sp.]|nr:MAG: hypothetical protein C0622_00450 [Desulfuromonas sp.]
MQGSKKYKNDGHAWAVSFLCLLLLLAFVLPASAALIDNERFRLSGFGTVGLVKGGDDTLGYQRDISQDGVYSGDWSLKSHSLLGLQGDLFLTADLDATLQLVAKDRPENSLLDSIEWAYLRYRVNPNLTVRVGRLGVDIFMLSEYRNVGFAYLWANPPMEFYGSIAFDHFDGADIALSTSLGSGTLSAKLFGGRAKNTFSSREGVIDLDLQPMIGGNLAWETDNWRLGLAVASVRFDSPLAVVSEIRSYLDQAAYLGWSEAESISRDLEVEGRKMLYSSAFLTYDSQLWTLTTEIHYIDSGYKGFPSQLGTYLSLGRRVGPVTLYGIAALAKSRDHEVIGEVPEYLALLQPLKAHIQELFDSAPIDQKTLSFGARWDINANLALKAQWDHSWVDAYGGALWLQREALKDNRILDTFTVNLSFVF